MIEKFTPHERYPHFLAPLLAAAALGLCGCSDKIDTQPTYTSLPPSEKATPPRELAVGDRVDSLPFITLEDGTSSRHTLETQNTMQDTGIIYTPFNSRDQLTEDERKNPHLHTATLLSSHNEKIEERLIVFDENSQKITHIGNPRELDSKDTMLAYEMSDGKLQYEIRLTNTDGQVTITYKTDS